MCMFASKTKKLRHSIVKRIAPKLYFEWVKNMNYISAVPRPFTLMLQKTFQNKKLVGAENVSANKLIGTGNGTVHVAFGGKVDHDIHFFHYTIDSRRIADIAFNEFVTFIFL